MEVFEAKLKPSVLQGLFVTEYLTLLCLRQSCSLRSEVPAIVDASIQQQRLTLVDVVYEALKPVGGDSIKAHSEDNVTAHAYTHPSNT